MNSLDYISENNNQEEVIWLNFTLCIENQTKEKIKIIVARHLYSSPNVLYA